MVDHVKVLRSMADALPDLLPGTRAAMHGAADEIERLREENQKLAKIIGRLNPENFPGLYFICGEGGEKDANGFPDRIMLCCAYGADPVEAYERTNI